MNYRYVAALIIFLIVSLIQHKEHIQTDIQGIHSWRQSQTMWNIRNFVRHDNNILNPRINSFNGGHDNLYRYEFPVMQWTIAQVERVFGENIEIVRMLIFLIGIFSIFGIFFLIHHLIGNWLVALVTSVLFQYSPLFYYYTINPIPDNLALCGGIWYFYFILKYYDTQKYKYLILGSISLLIAVLAKLPFIMYSVVSIYLFFNQIKKQKKLTIQDVKISLLQVAFLVPAITWYLWVIPTWTGNPVLYDTILGAKFVFSEYLPIIRYHASEMFPNILLSMPIWILFIIGIWGMIRRKFSVNWIYSLVLITFLYLIVELKSIGVVHDYYMFPFLPWLFVIIGLGIELIRRFSPKMKFLLLTICIFSAIYTQKTTYSKWSIEKSYFNKDVFLYSEELKNLISNDEHCIILNDASGYIFSYRIDKMGYIFKDDYLPMEWIDDMIRNQHVHYMYSDSEKLNNSSEFVKFIDEVMLVKGSIKVFKLKVPDDRKG